MEMERYKMFYKNKKNISSIRLLGEEFVKNNKNKGYIIYNNKKYSLQNLLSFQNNKNDNIKIKMLLSKDCYNKSCMFKDCSLLITIKCDYNNNSIKDSLCKGENIYCISEFDDKEKLNFYDDENVFNNMDDYSLLKFLMKIDDFNENIYDDDDSSILKMFELLMKFDNCSENEINDDYKWNTKISVMNEIFSNCKSLISLPDISSWDTSKVIDMNKIFYNCKSLSSIPDISKWDTSNVIYMDKMFYNCLSLSLLPDISNWNINNIKYINKMFYNCSSLSLLPDINKWNINNNNLNYMINDCHLLMEFPKISKRKTKNVKMNSMYERNSTIIKLIYDITDIKKIKIFSDDFVYKNKRKCKMIINNKVYLLNDIYQITENNIKSLKIKLLILNNIKIDLSCMFSDCSSLKEFSIIYPNENKKKEKLKEDIKENQPGSLKSNDLNSQLYQIYSHSESNEINRNSNNEYKLFNYIKQINHLIYNSNNYNISDIELNKINKYYISSINFIEPLSLFNSSEIQNYCYNEVNSKIQYSFTPNNSKRKKKKISYS